MTPTSRRQLLTSALASAAAALAAKVLPGTARASATKDAGACEPWAGTGVVGVRWNDPVLIQPGDFITPSFWNAYFVQLNEVTARCSPAWERAS